MVYGWKKNRSLEWIWFFNIVLYCIYRVNDMQIYNKNNLLINQYYLYILKILIIIYIIYSSFDFLAKNIISI